MANLLHRLARFYHIQSEYRDGLGQLRQAPPDAILSALKSLDAPLHSLDDVVDALRQRRLEIWQGAIEPVTVAWQHQPLIIPLRLPSRLAQASAAYEIEIEGGARLHGRCKDIGDRKPCFREVEGIGFVVRRLLLRRPLPPGYHRLRLRLDDLRLESALFSAPLQAYAPGQAPGKRWGLFCPLYALRSATNWGAGDFSDLAALASFTGALNGNAIGALPMLAGFLDEPFNPSPYAPVSRLFWNEFYLNVTRIPEFTECSAAQALVQADAFVAELTRLRAASLVDYRSVMALKRRVIEAMLDFMMTRSSARRDSFESFIANHPNLQDYAAFRAKVERERRSWQHWDRNARDGVLGPDSGDERVKRYHLYAQWLCEDQTGWLHNEAKLNGAKLYFDFPLGVNRDGYDVWRQRKLFALGASAGAPPDGLFVKGQNWGFPPFHPEAIQQDRYRYYIACLRHHMTHAAMLRIDHVMGMHRAFWVPEGFSAAEGLYVHHRAEEFYAILSLESHRHQVEIVGENLGTVPEYVNHALLRHRFLGMHVSQFGVSADPQCALDTAPMNTVTSLNTHDTATFMGFWTGGEIDDRLALGLIDREQAEHEQRYRAAQRDALEKFLRGRELLEDGRSDPEAILKGWLTFLAGSEAEFLLVNLEDLWLEAAPQNVPGTWQERPNWQRKARCSLDELRALPQLAEFLKILSDKRSAIS
ncbi:MAG: 4-alpha-glucanotransferase [Chloroflexota bacterium]